MARRGQAILSALLLASLAGTAHTRPYPVPTICANNIAETINEAADAIYSIEQAVFDCTLHPRSLANETYGTHHEWACTSQIMGMIEHIAKVGSLVASATLTCEDLDNNCARDVLAIIGQLAVGCAELVAAADDCVDDPFVCTIDIATAILELNEMVLPIIDAVERSCNPDFIAPVSSSSLIAFRKRDKLREELKDDLHNKLRGKGHGGYFDFEPGSRQGKKGRGSAHYRGSHDQGQMLEHRRLHGAHSSADGKSLEDVMAPLEKFNISPRHLQVVASAPDFAPLAK